MPQPPRPSDRAPGRTADRAPQRSPARQPQEPQGAAGATPPRPAIWAEGSQRPPFSPRAFVHALWLYARADAGWLLAQAAAGKGRFADRVLAGRLRLPVRWMGRAARFVPDHRSLGALLDRIARLTALAARQAAGVQAPRALPFGGWDGAPVRPQADPVVTLTTGAVAPPAPAARRPAVPPQDLPPQDPAMAADADTISAIRAAMREAMVMPRHPLRDRLPRRQPRRLLLPALSPGESDAPGPVFRMLARGLGWLVLALCLPVGAVQALAAHLRGEDLRLID